MGREREVRELKEREEKKRGRERIGERREKERPLFLHISSSLCNLSLLSSVEKEFH